MDKEITKKYSNKDITIIWQPNKCIHSTKCWRGEEGLKSVFNPSEKPWIKPEGASSDEIIKRINNCPSGALSYIENSKENTPEAEVSTEQIIEVVENGPLMVYGNIVIKDKEGKETHKNKVTAFCRCGHSKNKPYCDGSHVKEEFKG